MSSIVLAVYVDDILISGDDSHGTDLSKYLSTHFHMKDLSNLHYFLGIKGCSLSAESFSISTKVPH